MRSKKPPSLREVPQCAHWGGGSFPVQTGHSGETTMSLPYKKSLIPRAKELRKNATKQEDHLWYDFLRTYSVRFQRQKAIDGFIADFYCASAKLVIELDGSQHYTGQGLAYDAERDAILSKYGLQILRFSNEEVNTQFDAVCSLIDAAVQKRLQR